MALISYFLGIITGLLLVQFVLRHEEVIKEIVLKDPLKRGTTDFIKSMDVEAEAIADVIRENDKQNKDTKIDVLEG